MSEPRHDRPESGGLAPAPTGPTSRPDPEPVPGPAGPSAPTVLTGLVVLTVLGLIAVTRLTDVQVDYGLVLPVGMVVAGVLLLLGTALAVVRSRRR